jgi:phage terminase large subunit-like protein
MNSALAAPRVLGAQRPRFCLFPDYVSSAGQEAIELALMAGLDLDPWQQFVLTHALGEMANGSWAAFEVGVVVPRQNGKGGLLEARELAGLFLLGERLLIHSAHQFDTSLEAFRRLLTLIEETPEFDQKVKRVSRSHGEEGIELKGGRRIRFRTRTKGGGRGFSGDFLALDEAMDLQQSAHSALLPTLSARPNPQVWYTGSAVDQEVHDHGLVLAGVRERGVSGDADGLAYFEWSADADLISVEKIAMSEEAWAAANPGLGIRISTSHVALEQQSMNPRAFAVERLGVGDWPTSDGSVPQVIPAEAWAACTDKASTVDDPVCFAFDVRPDRSAAAIGVAGERSDGRMHTEVVDHRPGTGWVVDRLVELVEKHQPMSVKCDQASAAASLLTKLANAGVEVETVNATEHAQACGVLFDAVEQGRLRHLGTPELQSAVRGAAKRQLSDAWAWSRRSSGVDISPLVACTLALWGFEGTEESVYETRGLMILGRPETYG